MRPDKAYRNENGALRIDGTAVQAPEPRKNVALRTEVLMNPASRNPQLQVRSRPGQGVGSYYALSVFPGGPQLALDAWVDGQRTKLGDWSLPRTYAPDEWLPVELRVIDDEITISAGGKVIATLRDDKVPNSGALKLYALAAGYFRNTEYLPLDGLPPAAAYPQPEQWIDVSDNVRKRGTAEGSLQPDGEWLTTAGRTGYFRLSGDETFTGSIIRAVFKNRVGLKLRRDNQGRGYLADLFGGKARIVISGGPGLEVVSPWTEFAAPGNDAPHEAVFSAEGSQLRLWVDGHLVCAATDEHLPSGGVELTCMADASGQAVHFRKVEYGRLSTPSAPPQLSPSR
jgi:hypothetical protein